MAKGIKPEGRFEKVERNIKPPSRRGGRRSGSGRKKGVPNKNTGHADVRDLARFYTKDAIERLAHWMQSDDAKASVSASSALLDRGWGKPTQPISGDDDSPPVKLVVEWAAPSG